MWIEHFLLFGVVAFGIGWVVVKRVWFVKMPLVIRAFTALVLVFPIMAIMGAILSFLVSIFELGAARIISAVLTNPSGAFAYYSEIGAETTVFWAVASIVRITIFVFRDIKSFPNNPAEKTH